MRGKKRTTNFDRLDNVPWKRWRVLSVRHIPGKPWPVPSLSFGILRAEFCRSRMECAKCSRLTTEYEQLERAYCAAIEALANRRPTAPKVEYKALRSSCDRARADSEVARLRLLEHLASHSRTMVAGRSFW